MIFERYLQVLGALAFGALVSTAAIGQVQTRFVAAGGAATSGKMLPGGSIDIDVRVDAPATQTVGAAFRIMQTVPLSPSSFFQITARDFVASVYNDTTSGTPDAQVLSLPSALLSPSNGDNLGRNTIGLAGAAAGVNLFVEKFTLSVDPATPLGSYRIQPTPGGTSAVTDTALNDYDMSAARFDVVVGRPLTVTKSGTGYGTVSSDVGAINCGATCSDIYPGTTVTLTAAPGIGGAAFAGWSGGGCSGTGTCMVTVNAATTVNAQFDSDGGNLVVGLGGTGLGLVTSAPSGIHCPALCAVLFPAGAVVTLTATPAAGSIFSGWSGGGCAGTGTCTLVVNAALIVTASFDNVPPLTLTVTKSGPGLGTVTSVPAGITCGGTCAAPFAPGTIVNLTATPLSGLYLFLGWTGAGCSGLGTCTVTMNANSTVNALFVYDEPATTTITGGPTNPSNLANPTFTFAADDIPVTFRCSLDGGLPIVCTSPHTASVGNGPHVFSVFATDSGGNVGNTATYSWVVAGIATSNVPIPALHEAVLALLALALGIVGLLEHRRSV